MAGSFSSVRGVSSSGVKVTSSSRTGLLFDSSSKIMSYFSCRGHVKRQYSESAREAQGSSISLVVIIFVTEQLWYQADLNMPAQEEPARASRYES